MGVTESCNWTTLIGHPPDGLLNTCQKDVQRTNFGRPLSGGITKCMKREVSYLCMFNSPTFIRVARGGGGVKILFRT